jgi:hypothetical protein
MYQSRQLFRWPTGVSSLYHGHNASLIGNLQDFRAAYSRGTSIAILSILPKGEL